MGDSGAALVAVVDDDAAVCEATSSLLRSAGYRCATFDSAETFLTSAHVDDIKCILLDIRMPGMSGLDLHVTLSRIRSDIPVIYVTGAPENAFRERALSQGAAGFFAKPFPADDLLNLISAALDGSDSNGRRRPIA